MFCIKPLRVLSPPQQILASDNHEIGVQDSLVNGLKQSGFIRSNDHRSQKCQKLKLLNQSFKKVNWNCAGKKGVSELHCGYVQRKWPCLQHERVSCCIRFDDRQGELQRLGQAATCQQHNLQRTNKKLLPRNPEGDSGSLLFIGKGL